MKLGLYVSHGSGVPETIRAACLDQLTQAGFDLVIFVVPAHLRSEIADRWPASAVHMVQQECVRPCLLDRWHRIDTGLQGILRAQPVHLLEHDVYYPDDYAKRPRPDRSNVATYMPAVRLTRTGWGTAQELSSTCCARAGYLRQISRRRCETLEAGHKHTIDEPGKAPLDPGNAALLKCPGVPVIDIRHGNNYTGDRTAQHTHHPELGDFAAFWQIINDAKHTEKEPTP